MADESAETWDDAGYVLASKYRTAAMLELQSGPATPSQVAREREAHGTHIAAAMRDLRDDGLVELRVSEDRHKHKIQALTDHGEAVAEALETVVENGD